MTKTFTQSLANQALRAWWRARTAGVLLALLAGSLPGQAQSIANARPPAGNLLLRQLATRPALSQAAQVLRQELALTANDELRPLRTETDELGMVHQRFQQYYRGVKVEHGELSVHARTGRIELLSGELLRAAAMPAVQPALSEATALQHALQAVGARVYQWQVPGEEQALRATTHDATATYVPKGELVLLRDARQAPASAPLVLAWKFNIYAHQPVSRALIYVDAQTGQVVLRDAIIKHVNATGTGATRYLGTRPIFADQFGGGYRLRESVHGKGVVTLNCKKSNSYAAAVDFVDNDNNWTAAECDNANFDNAALDAHVGAQVTQDYWTTVHGRDSYDDKGSVLLNYVHYDDVPGGAGYENAYWNGIAMTYGDGATTFKPLTAVDVCGHEIGHAVCETTAGLIYQNESGALNEGLSDIWGACVENHLDPSKQIWLIGEDIMKAGGALRSMSNPNLYGQPDTYLGTNWKPTTTNPTSANDYGGVHTNSGVLNYWFYLMCQGGAGTNDAGTTFSVSGINIGKGARIAYRAERLYMTASSTYAGARAATMQAAVDLYGLGSAEVTAVAQAWRAVGLGEPVPTITSLSVSSGTVGQAVTITGTNLGTTYRVRFNGTDGTAATLGSTTSVTVTIPAGATTGTIVLTTPSGSATSATFTVLNPGPVPTLVSVAPAGGATQGSAVTLTGTNLAGATAVSFNATAATFTAVSAATITTTVPAGATSGAISVTTPNGIASISFTVLPAVTSFSPTSGPPGTAVIIIGTTLSNALNVKFNGVYVANFTVVNATTITATVPVGATTGPLTVRTPDGTATGPINFTVTPAVVFTSFAPTSGPVGTVVTLTGQGFTGASSVTFNGTAATAFTVASDQEIWATVPAGARSGYIAITTPQGTATSSRMYEVTVASGGPVITSFSPASGPVGTSLTILGSNFTGATAVAVNGTPVSTFNVVNAGRVTATVAAGTTSGPISVATPAATCLSATDFNVTPANDLVANAIVVGCGSVTNGTTLGATHTGDPTAACNGTAVLSGTTIGVFYKFVGLGGSVTVNTCANASYDGQLVVFSGTPTSLVCVGGDDDGCGTSGGGSTVTFTATAGTNYYLYVAGFGTGTGNFTLTLTCADVPTISSFTPSSGPGSTSVAITGSKFTGATSVSFNGTPASFTVNSATSISTTLPAGATTGPITVQTPLGTGVSASFFTVLPPAISLFTPALGPAGTTVTITGSSFTGISAVRFNGVDAASFTVSSATLITAVVPAAATTGTITVVGSGGTTTTSASFEVLTLFTGTFNQCLSTTPISSTGTGTWQWLRAANGQLVAAINDQGFALGQVSAEFQLNQGSVRADGSGNEYLDRNWHLVTQNQFPGRTVLVRFFAANAEFSTYVAANDGDASDATSLTQLRLTQYEGANEDCQMANNSTARALRLLTPAAPLTPAGSNWFALEAAVPDHFSEFYISGNSAKPLPVELVAFTAQRTGGRVLAQWRTAQETNNQGFVLERSADGRSYADASTLLPGAGSSSVAHAYSFTDVAAPVAATYYRLRQLDMSGAVAYSPVVRVAELATAAKLACFPQPAHAGTTVVGALPGRRLTFSDALGRTLATATADADGRAELSLPTGLAAGVYVVRSGTQATRLVVE
jgi:bacillolysin